LWLSAAASNFLQASARRVSFLHPAVRHIRPAAYRRKTSFHECRSSDDTATTLDGNHLHSRSSNFKKVRRIFFNKTSYDF
jgi:hypothetical protein